VPALDRAGSSSRDPIPPDRGYSEPREASLASNATSPRNAHHSHHDPERRAHTSRVTSHRATTHFYSKRETSSLCPDRRGRHRLRWPARSPPPLLIDGTGGALSNSTPSANRRRAQSPYLERRCPWAQTTLIAFTDGLVERVERCSDVGLGACERRRNAALALEDLLLELAGASHPRATMTIRRSWHPMAELEAEPPLKASPDAADRHAPRPTGAQVVPSRESSTAQSRNAPGASGVDPPRLAAR